MKIIKLVKSVSNAIKDPERDFSERVFLILTFMSEATVLIATISDLITRENISEIIVLVATLIGVPIIVLISLHYNKLYLAIRFIVLCLVFVILPMLFFFGGGVEGGGVIWIIFAYMYVGLVLTGNWRKIMFVLLTVLAFMLYMIAYYCPELVYQHSKEMFYIDSVISLVLVGIQCFVMTWSQGLLFTEENKRAKKEAERAEELTRSQNRFFSSMSHEIRTPINSILGLNELILRDQNASDDIIKDASGIQGAGKMLLALINDILDFSKIESGSMDIVPVDYRIGDMLSEIVNMMWLRAHDKGLGFEVSVDPEVPRVLYGDEVRIKQIIINLLNNAVKYTKEGRVGLRIESDYTDEETVELKISIFDTGMGIKKEDIPYLFDAFKRVDEGKNRHIEGTGLGLSIVKQLVELMDGSVTVNSIYGDGSTFTVTVKQTVSDHNCVGELNIHNQSIVKRSTYESSFLAPEARILIVDDNEMNLEVESRLLKDTDMIIDKALSGKEALDKCIKTHYDAIFMDHLMPGMDGIECLESLRNQTGSINRNTPVIVLTANAGSENRELYTRAGFDGYLVKPVSGEAMEEILIRHISAEKIVLKSVMTSGNEEINTSERYADKLPVIITSSSMCDLPDQIVSKLHIPIIPFIIRTEEGEFRDGIHMDAYELVKYISSGREAVSSPPDEAEYTMFYSNALKRAHHIIHIAITTSMSNDYTTAYEAAKAFDNVTVINSECLSSSTGLLVLIAYKLAAQGMPVNDIISELDNVKRRLRCSFIINTTEYMARKGLFSSRLHKIVDAFSIHPSLKIKDDKASIGGVWAGRTRRAYRKYIYKALPSDVVPDPDVVFVTYADLDEETLAWIKEEIMKRAYFENIIFQQASAAISSNCGPGTFGILYFLKSEKSYNIASFFENTAANANEDDTEDMSEESDTDAAETDMNLEEDAYSASATAAGTANAVPAAELKWYEKLENIDGEAAIKNSGSEDAFKTVLKIFYDSIPDKYEELEDFYSSEDWENYTIKIHALKSSAKLVGALELADNAQRLETAGKEGNTRYIMDHHYATMEDYLKFYGVLGPLFEEAEEEGGQSDKPVADEFLMAGIYEGLLDAAKDMDCDMIEDIFKDADGYAIPDQEKEKFAALRSMADSFDYDGMIQMLTT